MSVAAMSQEVYAKHFNKPPPGTGSDITKRFGSEMSDQEMWDYLIGVGGTNPVTGEVKQPGSY